MTRKILIYGGSGGIGSATARLLRERGCEVYLAGRNKEKLSAVADELGADFMVGDVQKKEFFSQVMDNIKSPLDGVVYAVGTLNLRSLKRLNETDFLNDFRVNAMGAALAVQAALPALKKSSVGSSVVLFSSIAAIQGFTFHASLGMAKGAVSGLTLSLAAELAPKIRVNAIAPSLIQTPLSEKLLSNEQIVKSLAKLHALQRLGTSEDIATLTAFLLSSDANWITGQIINIDGGRSTLHTKN